MKNDFSIIYRSLHYFKKITVARNGLPEDQWLRDQTAERGRQVAWILEPLQ